MLRIIGTIARVQLLLLCVLIFRNQIAGPKNGQAWFAFIALTLLGLTVAGKSIDH